MDKYRLTRKAVEDLTIIWNYTFDEWSEKKADSYYKMLLDKCQRIANNPKLGKTYKDISPGLRGLRAERHIVFFRLIEPDFVEITRILHGRMNLKNRLLE